MRSYQCKCGFITGSSSMGFPACTTCEKCGSTLATGPDSHPEPIPHDWQTMYDENTGKPYRRCKRCMKREKQAYDGSPAIEIKEP